MRYRAFISYSQQDKAWGVRLHHWLEGYRVPQGVRADIDAARKLGRFFRDNDEMPATSDLATRVRQSLDQSASLIVICSPRAARSKWVAAEIQYFRQIGRGHRIFAFIIDGEPNSGDPVTECFPLPFRAAVDLGNPNLISPQPLGLDVREEGRARACARLAAGLLGIDFDDLWQRDRRRTAARQRWWIGGLSTATLAFAGLAAAAIRFGLAAQRSSVRAEEARARLLADTSTRFLDEGNVAEALGYAAVALDIAQSNGAGTEVIGQAERATRQALSAYHLARVRLVVTYRGHAGRITDVATSADGRLLVTAGDDGVARLYERATGILLKEVRHQSAVVSVSFFDDDRYLLSAAKDGRLTATNVDKTGHSFEASLGARLLGTRLTPASDAVLAWGLSGRIALWHPLEGRVDEFTKENGGPTLSAEFLQDNPNAVYLDQGTRGSIISLRERNELHVRSGSPAGRDTEQGLISFIDKDGLEVFDLRSERVVCKFEARGILSSVVDASADRVVTHSIRLLEFRALNSGALISTHKPSWAVRGVTKTSAGNRLVVWGQHNVEVFRLDDCQPVFDIKPRFEVINAEVFDATGRLLLTGYDGRAGVWSLADGTELKSIEGPSAIHEARFGEEGRSVWVARDSGELQVIALEDGAVEGRFFHDDTVLGWEVSAETAEFLTWSADGTAKLWSWQPSPSVRTNRIGGVRADKFVVNHEIGLAFSSQDADFSVWRLSDDTPIAQGSLGIKITHFLPSNDGMGMILFGEGRVCVWNFATSEYKWWETKVSYQALAYSAGSFALYNKDTKKVASIDLARVMEGPVDLADDAAEVFVVGGLKALAVSHANGEIDVYPGDGRSPATTLITGRELAYCVASGHENRIASIAPDGVVTVFELDDSLKSSSVWVPPVRIPMDQLRKYNPLQLNRHIFFVGTAGKLIWLDPDSCSVLRDETAEEALDFVWPSGDGQRIAALSDRGNCVLLFELGGGAPRRLEHRSKILGLHFLAGNGKIATWSADRMLKVWKVNGDLEHELSHFGIVRGVEATPEGDLLVSWTDTRELAYWDVETGAKLFETRVDDKIRDVRFLRLSERMLIVHEHESPALWPHIPRERLMKVAADLLAALRPLSLSELRGFQNAEGMHSGTRIGSTSKPVGQEAQLTGVIELGQLADGGMLLVTDTSFDAILQLVEYNEFDQLLTIHGFDGSVSTMAQPIPLEFLDDMRRQKSIIVYTLFPDHEPSGYLVPLARQ